MFDVSFGLLALYSLRDSVEKEVETTTNSDKFDLILQLPLKPGAKVSNTTNMPRYMITEKTEITIDGPPDIGRDRILNTTDISDYNLYEEDWALVDRYDVFLSEEGLTIESYSDKTPGSCNVEVGQSLVETIFVVRAKQYADVDLDTYGRVPEYGMDDLIPEQHIGRHLSRHYSPKHRLVQFTDARSGLINTILDTIIEDWYVSLYSNKSHCVKYYIRRDTLNMKMGDHPELNVRDLYVLLPPS